MRFALLSLLFLFSCATPQQIEKSREAYKGREAGGEFFYVKPDGQKVTVAEIKRPSVGNHTSERIIVEGKNIDAPNEVMAFQNADGYYKFYKDPKPTKYWKGQFIRRLRAGTIGLYQRGYSGGGGQTSPEDYYYFDKADGPLTWLTFESFSEALRDKPALLAEFERLYPKKKIAGTSQLEANRVNLPRLVEEYNR